jgi:hypothetical protein
MIYEIIHSIVSCVGAITILTIMSLAVDKAYKLITNKI